MPHEPRGGGAGRQPKQMKKPTKSQTGIGACLAAIVVVVGLGGGTGLPDSGSSSGGTGGSVRPASSPESGDERHVNSQLPEGDDQVKIFFRYGEPIVLPLEKGRACVPGSVYYRSSGTCK